MSATVTAFPTALVEGDAIFSDEPANVARPARLRLTRRGRMFFGTLLSLGVLLVLAIVAVFGSTSAVATTEAGGADFGYVVVAPGASLWEVASQIDDSVDPRDLVAEIVRLNQLVDSGVQAGQPIAVPLRYADAPGVMSASDLGL